MKAGGWYTSAFITTFLYFYIYAVNYVRGAEILPDEIKAQNIMGYIAEKVENNYRVRRDLDDLSDDERDARQVPQQPLFPRLSWQYHNYTR